MDLHKEEQVEKLSPPVRPKHEKIEEGPGEEKSLKHEKEDFGEKVVEEETNQEEVE